MYCVKVFLRAFPWWSMCKTRIVDFSRGLVFCIVLVKFAGLSPIMCGLLPGEVLLLCCIYLLGIVKGGWKLLSKIIPRNLARSISGISVDSRLGLGSFCIFFNWQKWTHWVFLSSIIRLSLVVHWLIFLMRCYSWRSIVDMYFGLEIIKKSWTY